MAWPCRSYSSDWYMRLEPSAGYSFIQTNLDSNSLLHGPTLSAEINIERGGLFSSFGARGSYLFGTNLFLLCSGTVAAGGNLTNAPLRIWIGTDFFKTTLGYDTTSRSLDPSASIKLGLSFFTNTATPFNAEFSYFSFNRNSTQSGTKEYPAISFAVSMSFPIMVNEPSKDVELFN